uniref:DUF629 domain-containing protein n=1 Tax=Oryza punctata TaxID=4537 RepID=A0A0E0LYY0_ORYPU
MEAMRLDREGRHNEVIAHADELAAKHPEYAVVLHLASGDGSDGQASCDRAICMEEPTDPREEDVPPGSIPGEKPEDRKSYIRTELKFLLQKRVLSCRDYWCSLASEKQDSFRLVGLNSLHEHFDVFYQDDQEAAKTISDALNFVKKNKSWRFWICPYCVGKKIPDIDSLLQNMRNKHPEGGFWTKLLSVLDPKSISGTYQGDHFSDTATTCQDSQQNYVLHFKRMDDIFKYLFLRAADKIKEKPFSQIREEKCRKGIFIFEKIKLKMKNAPTNMLSSEVSEFCQSPQTGFNPNPFEISCGLYNPSG